MIKRLGIFCTYDSAGVVDDYIIFLLQDMKKVLSHLAIVCNGKLLPESRARLEKFTDDIFVRENEGYDMEAWRQGILHKNLNDYDELILFNNSFYGPLYSFVEVFDKMDAEKSDADFWGITVHGQMADELQMCPYGYIPEHLQSYFLVIRQRMLHSPEFFDYWKNLKMPENFQEAIRLNETCFTKIFFDKGFTYAVYCDTREYEKNYDRSIDHCLMSTEILLKKYKCPIVKKKVFLTPRYHYMLENYGDEPRKTLNFLKEHTNYDLNLIWQNLLRKQNIAAVKTTLALNYILPAKKSDFDDKEIFKDTAIIAHLYYKDLIAECTNFLFNAPPEISIFVTVNSEEKKSLVEAQFQAAGRKVEVRLVNNRGRDFSALLVGCADVFEKFKYVCFVHDKKSIRAEESVAIGREFFHLLWKNVLCSRDFIKNILETFAKEPNLGILSPPHPYNGGYKNLLFFTKYWSGECYNSTVELAKNLGISTEFIDLNFAPLAIGSVFWFRTAALKKITAKTWKVEDFPAEPMPTDGTISHALERIFPFAAQAEGFYTGWVIAEEFAKQELENFIYFASDPRILPAPASNSPIDTSSLTPEQNQLMYEYFLNLTSFQVLKFFLQSRISPNFWGIFRPFKTFLSKLGFKV